MAKRVKRAQRPRTPKADKKEIGILLGGGAPNLCLTAGALLELHDYLEGQKKERKLYFAMAGAGAVVGLSYLAPTNGLTPTQALRNTKNFGVSDPIYDAFPVNYKVFTKSGPPAECFNDYWYSLPQVQDAMDQYGMSDEEAFCSDLLLFAGAMMCPTDLNFYSQGVCGHAPFLDSLVDFKKLGQLDPINDVEIEINAFCLENRKVTDFSNKLCRITRDHLRAALSFPFLHAPYEVDGYHYYEGAAMQCLNEIPQSELNNIDRFIVLDPLQPNMISFPRDLWDAYALSIIMPTTGLAVLGRELLEQSMGSPKGRKRVLPSADTAEPLSGVNAFSQFAQQKKLYLANFDIPEDEVPESWGWSRSSMERLFEIGRKAGKKLRHQLDCADPLA